MRFEVQLTCRLKRDGVREILDATTLNLGRLGALVVSSVAPGLQAVPQPGDAVNLEVLLPAHQHFGQRCLACDAVAVRATREGSKCFIALRFEHVEIRKVLNVPQPAASLAVM